MNKQLFLLPLVMCLASLVYAENSSELNFVAAKKIPKEFRPKTGEGVANIQIVNQTDKFITFGLIGTDGNLRHGWTDGNSGTTSFYVGPGCQTDPKYPYRAVVGACFVIFSLDGQILGHGSPSKVGDYVLTIK